MPITTIGPRYARIVQEAVAMLRARDAEIARLRKEYADSQRDLALQQQANALRASAAGGNGAARAVAELEALIAKFEADESGPFDDPDDAIDWCENKARDRIARLQSEAQPPAVPAGAVEPNAKLLRDAHAFWIRQKQPRRAVVWLSNVDTGELLIFTRGEYRNELLSLVSSFEPNGTRGATVQPAPATSAPSAPEPAGDDLREAVARLDDMIVTTLFGESVNEARIRQLTRVVKELARRALPGKGGGK
jgi:hypothetical protein